jgi:photosystem II stability/assembly factor-like uncharacterized protein
MHRVNLPRLWFLGFATAAQLASAASWDPVGPYGGAIREIFVRPGTPDLAFVLTEGGLYRSVDGGHHWSRAERGVRGTVGASYRRMGDLLAFDPVDAQRAYLMDADGALYYSLDAGSQWRPTGYELAGAEPLELAVDSSTPRRLYLGTSAGIWRSIDGGISFQPASEGLPPAQIIAIAVDPADERHLLAAGSYTYFFYSNDGGDHWLPGKSGCTHWEANCGWMEDLHFAGERAYAEAYGGIFTSTDGIHWQGVNTFQFERASSISAWDASSALIGGDFGAGFTADGFSSVTLVNNGLSLDGVAPLDVTAVSLFSGYPAPGPWFAGTYAGGIFRSDDAGSSWHASNDGLAAMEIRGLAFDPNGPSHAFAGGLDSTYPSEHAPVLYASTDGGSSWVQVASPPPARLISAIVYDRTMTSAETTIYATGLHSGGPWDEVVNSGIYKTTDGGVSWTILEGGLPTSGDPPRGFVGIVRTLSLDPRSCASPPLSGVCTTGPLRVLYATAGGKYGSTRSHRVIKSIDAGATWSSSEAGLPQDIPIDLGFERIAPKPLIIDPSNTQIVYIGTGLDTAGEGATDPGIQSGVYRSDDAGAHWTFRSDGLPRYPGSTNTALDVHALAIHPVETGTLWAGLSNGYETAPAAIYKTTDGGAHWSDSSTGLGLARVTAIVVDPGHPNTLYAGGDPLPRSRVSVFRTDDGGLHWTPDRNSPPTGKLAALALDPLDRTHMLAGTNAGIWTFVDAIFADGFEPSALP